MDSIGEIPWSAIAITTLLISLIYRFVVFPALISPLAKVPNAHWSAPISPFWVLYTRFKKRENGTLYDAHKRLGPYIRIAPNEVSIDDIQAVRTVYQGGFEKPEWYSVFDNYGVPCMFSTRPSREHSLRKRFISNVYSKSYIQSSSTAEAQANVILYSRLLPILEESVSESQAPHGIDVYSLFHATVMDFISAYIWGISRSTNFIQTKGYREHWLELYKSRNGFAFFPQELPRLTTFFKKAGVYLYPNWVDAANEELAEFNMKSCQATMKHLETFEGKTEGTADDPIVMKAFLAGIRKEEEANGEQSIIYPTAVLRRDLSVASEVWDHVLAGQETSGLTLTYLCWRMSQHAELQKKLREELLTIEPNMALEQDSSRLIPDPKKLDSLPLLHAILQESLRLHAPIPGPQPRETPQPHAKIGPYKLPGGVRIAALAHTLHRDERVFPHAEEWEPSRWLEADEDTKKDMNRQFWAFGSGGRMCIGSNFAMHEMKLIVAAIYTNFTSHIVDDTGIEQGDGYTGRPASEQLFLRFEKV